MFEGGILMLVIQIGFAVHAMRRGHPLFWVFLIVFVPLLGCILYVVMVLLPEASQSRTAMQGTKALKKALDPQKELRRLRQVFEQSDTVGNRMALATECLKHGKADEAVELYEGALTGFYKTDADLLLSLAKALAQAKNFPRVLEVLDNLTATNPDYDHPDARLLYAEALEETGDNDTALAHYQELASTAPSAETKCRYALLLKRVGRDGEARGLFEEVVRDAKAGSRHSYQLNKEWVDRARKALG